MPLFLPDAFPLHSPLLCPSVAASLLLHLQVPHLLPGIVQNEGDLKLLPSGSHPQVHQFKSLVFDLMRKVVQQHGASHR